MTVFVAIVLVLLVAAYVVSPLLRTIADVAIEPGSIGSELWKREKAVAVLAITEADFDRATGKLSDADYRVLRSDYEGRALQAMDEIDRLAPAARTARAGISDAASAGTSDVRFCAGCGARFAPADAYCGSCGRPRSASS